MKLKEIYQFFVQEGIKADLRKKKQIQRFLFSKKKEYQNINKALKKFFDKESLTNPYSDTRILFGDPHKDIRTILVGIDIDVSELLLAQQLSQNGKSIDLVLAHHPEGVALAGLYDVMYLQSDLLENLGIDEKIAKDLMKKRIDDVARRVHGSNHSKVVDAARLLNLPFMCCHTPADNHVAGYLQKKIDQKKPKTLQSLVHLLLKEKEYQLAAKDDAGPKIFVGKEQDKSGKVLVDMTGGTSGSKDVYARLSQLGIQTKVAMHVSDTHYNKLKSEYINTVIAGHIASDSLGLNLLLDKLQKKTNIKIYECSGFRRVIRKL